MPFVQESRERTVAQARETAARQAQAAREEAAELERFIEAQERAVQLVQARLRGWATREENQLHAQLSPNRPG